MSDPASGHRRRAAAAIVIAGGLLVVACTHGPGKPTTTTRGTLPPRSTGTTNTTMPTVPTPSVLDGTSWVLVPSSLGVPVPEGVSVTAVFADSRVTGSSGCNAYFGQAGAAASSTSFRAINIGGTDRACEEEVGAVEAAYLARFTAAQSYVLVGDDLRLSGSAGGLWFRRAGAGAGPTSGALVGDWTVTGFLNQTTQVVAPARSGTRVRLGIHVDGTLWGAVCFSQNANWSATGDSIVITDFWGVDTVCSGPDGQPEDESDFFAALRGARHWQVEGDALTLSGTSGVLITATRTPV